MPVLETLGGALFGAILQVLFDKLDSRQVLDYFRGRELDEKLLKRLKRKLLSINALVHDAELKQISDSLVKAWLHEVRDALLDAEDLLDEIDFEFTKCKMEAEYHTSAGE
ncbi:putative disease resistance RPP13-like protein 1, partial [Mucuna pruriens]